MLVKGSDIIIAGAGVVGRLLAITLLRRGLTVTLIDRQNMTAAESCSSCAAGLLSPLSELDRSDRLIHTWGEKSLKIWQTLQDDFPSSSFLQCRGSLVLGHSIDTNVHDRLVQIWSQLGVSDKAAQVSSRGVQELEPYFCNSGLQGYYIEAEGVVDVPKFMEASVEMIESLGGLLRFNETIIAIEKGKVGTDLNQYSSSLVFDCRGLAARSDLSRLRGVLGEAILIHAPEVELSRSIRFMHSRYPIYVVPRGGGTFFVGATQLESDLIQPMSVRSYLELLSAVYSLSSGFGEARVLRTFVNLRPTFPDNLPKIFVSRQGIKINGLFRHGFLLAPYLAKLAADFLENNLAVDDGKPFVIAREEDSNGPY